MDTTGSVACPDNQAPAGLELLVGPPAGADPAATHYERQSVAIVEAGRPVARISPGAAFRPGDGASFDDDGLTIVARRTGVVRIEGAVVSIAPATELPGDVDFSTGNIDCPHDLLVRGSILDLFRVRSGGGIHVGRSIEAADVAAGGDIVVAGAIAGNDKGRCVAAGDVRAKVMSAAVIEAGGDVTAGAEIAHCRIACLGRLNAPAAAVYGGEITARGGIVCRDLGRPGAARTVVAAGMDWQLERLAAEHAPRIEAEMRQAAKVRQTVEPLLRNQRNLTPQQKEKATELLFQAGDIEQRNAPVIDMLRRRCQESHRRCREEIQVLGTLHAGVTVRFAGLEAVVPCDIGGPLSIAPRRRHGGQIVIAAPGRREIALETRAAGNQAMQALDALLAICAGGVAA